MSDDDRRRLAEEQRRLVESLTIGGHAGEAPVGMDQDRVRLAAESLIHKRRRGVAKAWPAVAASMGDQFTDFFAAYAKTHEQATEGYGEEGGRFAKWLIEGRMLPDAGRVEYVARRAARGWPIRVVRRQHGGWMVAVRIPGFGVRVVGAMRSRYPS